MYILCSMSRLCAAKAATVYDSKGTEYLDLYGGHA